MSILPFIIMTHLILAGPVSFFLWCTERSTLPFGIWFLSRWPDILLIVTVTSLVIDAVLLWYFPLLIDPNYFTQPLIP